MVNAKNQYISFWIGGRFFGCTILDVKEINSEFHITPIFHAPESMLGYVNLRGQICLIINLNPVLGIRDVSIDEKRKENGRLIIFKESTGESFGIFVDKVGDVLSVEPEDIEEFSAFRQDSNEENLKNSKVIGGITRLKNDLMVIINAREIIEDGRGNESHNSG